MRTPWRSWCRFGCVLTAGALLSVGSAQAQSPVAIVEDVNSPSAGVESMDYVPAGKTVSLQSNDTLTLGYLRSCWRESIVGGTVKVGPEQSEVKGGIVTRTKEQCDGGQMQLTPEQANKSGAMAFRKLTKRSADKAAPGEATITLYGSTPIFDLGQAGQLSIERLDQPTAAITIDVKGDQLLRGTFFDLAKSGKALAAGGLYRASHKERRVMFKIAESAAPGATSLLGRLVRFQRSSSQ